MREELNNLRKETETTLRVLYALKQFRMLLTDQNSVNKINENIDFWLIFETSLRTNLFIGIRRLYEVRNETFNFQKFIEQCLEKISQFNKENLKERKSKDIPKEAAWLIKYMKDAYEPTKSDFIELSRIVRENSKKMKGIYTNAASKIYAHAIHIDHATISQITESLCFDEIENALLSIWHCYEQVWQMYENGKKPSFKIGKYPYKKEVYESVIKQLG